MVSPVLLVPGCGDIMVETMRCDRCANVARPLFHFRDATGRDRFVCAQHRPQ